MNTLEQSPSYNRENAIVEGTLTAPVQLSTPGSGREHWHFSVLFLLMPLGAIALLVYLLRGVPADILRREFESLGAVVCALAYVAVFLRLVIRALAEDAKQAEVSGRAETLLAPRTLSQTRLNPPPSGNSCKNFEPVEQRT